MIPSSCDFVASFWPTNPTLQRTGPALTVVLNERRAVAVPASHSRCVKQKAHVLQELRQAATF